jgi:glutamate formiminotransferase
LSPVLECVVNVSEGRDRAVIDALGAAGGSALVDVHSDEDHNRAVLTMVGDELLDDAVRHVAALAMTLVDLRRHAGAHPRLGVVDVVPFVPLVGADMADAVAARDRFAAWAGTELGVPCFLYGPESPAFWRAKGGGDDRLRTPEGAERTLPEVRAGAFSTLAPDTGPPVPHPSAGAICVGARPVLVAYNVWLARGTGVDQARRVAAQVRGPAIRALGLDVGGRAQVSMNLVDPARVGPADAYDAVAALAPVERAELVGLLPAQVLEAVPKERWDELDLSPERTIESRRAANS